MYYLQVTKKEITKRMKNNDYLGGVVIFIVMFVIAFVELHFFKNVKAFAAPSSDSLVDRLWQGIGDTSSTRFERRGVVTVTGKVVGKKPHRNSDGDNVFSLKPDKQYQGLLTSANSEGKYEGGLWCEAICQGSNTSKEAVHKDDCKRGGPFPKFPMPKLGERWRVSGLHIIDKREDGQAEIHPITSMQKI